MKKTFLFACIFGLLFLSYSYAEDYSDKPFSAGVFLGGRAASGLPNANFNQYNGVGPGLFGGGYVHYDDKRGYYLNGDSAVLGDDDMYFNLKGGKWGSFRASLYYTEFPHNLSFKDQSLYATPGSQIQSFTGNGSTTGGVTNLNRWGSLSFDYKIRRKDAGGSFDLTAIKPFFINVEANQLKREGQIPWAGTSATSFNAVEFAVPVDNTTTNISGLVGWKNKQFYLAFGGGYSKFDNNAQFTAFRDPFTTGTTVSNGYTVGAPDNKSWNLRLTGTAKLPLSSTFALTAGYQNNTSSTNILNTIDAAGATTGTRFTQALNVNHGTFNGDITYWNVNASLTSNPWKSLNTKIYYNYLDKRNNDDAVTFGKVGSDPVGGGIFTYNKTTVGAEASYRFTKNLKGILGYEYTDLKRQEREAVGQTSSEEGVSNGFIPVPFQIPETWDNKFTGQVVFNPIDWLGTRLKYQKLYRDIHFNRGIPSTTDVNAAFTTSMENQFRRFDIGNKEQDMLKITVDLTPIQALDVAIEYAYKRDKLAMDNALGYQDAERNEFVVDASYSWKDFIKFFAFFDYETTTTNQLSRQGAGAAGQSPLVTAAPTTTNFNWNADLKNNNYAYGIGGVIPILKKKLSLIVQYDFEKNNGAADFTSQSFVAAQTAVGVNNNNISIPPWDDYTRQSISARLVYAVTKDLGLTFGYLYSQFRLNDGQLNGYTNVPLSPTGAPLNMLLSGAYTDQNYNVNLFYLKAMYKF